MYNAQGVKIEEVSVTDEQNSTYNYKKAQSASNGTYGVYTEERSNNTCKLKVYSPSKDTSKTFKVKYILQNVCVAHNDVGELYYNFIGGDWQCSIKNLDIDKPIINLNNIDFLVNDYSYDYVQDHFTDIKNPLEEYSGNIIY